jgi:signal transduction histidine kinase
LVVKGRVLAVAFVATTDRHHLFTRDEIDLLWGIANVVGLAIKNALLYRKAEQLAVLQERARLSREIHDELAQRLGAMQLMVSLTGEYLAHEQVSQASAVITRLRTTLSEAYGDLRDVIYDLRTVISSNMGFLDALREYLADYRSHYGMEISLEADGGDESGLTGRAQVQVFRIIQEALTNVRKHAQAKQVRIRTVRQGDQMQISVEDDGQGFDPSGVSAESGTCFGLLVMHERAESIGGTLTVESQIGAGTRIVIRCPAHVVEDANE